MQYPSDATVKNNQRFSQKPLSFVPSLGFSFAAATPSDLIEIAFHNTKGKQIKTPKNTGFMNKTDSGPSSVPV